MAPPCLKPEDSLRQQLNKAFITTSLASLAFVLVVVLSTIHSIANMTESEATDALVGQLKSNTVRNSGDIAATVYKRMNNIAGVVSIIEQALLDRMAGYPAESFYADDSYLPFENAEEGNARGYPLPQRETYLDVDLVGAELDNSRFNYHADMSLERSVFWFPGVCDEDETDPSGGGYYEGCVAAQNNNLTSGGVVSEYGAVDPTDAGARPPAANLVRHLADKSAHLDHFMAPLYETYEDIFNIGVWFYNEGNCAVRTYPGINPIPFGTYSPDDCDSIECVRHGGNDDNCYNTMGGCEDVVGRDYNCVERGWFQYAVGEEHAGELLFPDVPYTNAWTPEGVTTWLMAFSKAVFDRVNTDELIAVVTVEIEISALVSSILDIEFGEETDGTVSLVQFDDGGTVIADRNWAFEEETETVSIFDLDNGISEALWGQLKSEEFEEDWQDVFEYSHGGEDYYLARFPVPPPPGSIGSDYSSWQEASESGYDYSPDYLVLVSVSKDDVHEPLEAMSVDMSGDVTVLSLVTTALVLLGSALTVFAVRRVADELCAPLAWMSDIAERITGNAAGEDLAAGVDAGADFAEADDEIGELVHEFKTMVRGLGGSAAAGTLVAAKQLPANDFAGDRMGAGALHAALGLREPWEVLREGGVLLETSRRPGEAEAAPAAYDGEEVKG